MKIKDSTKKILNELNYPERWSNDLFTIKHETGFEIIHPQNMLFVRLWKQPIKWNLREKFLIWKKSFKIKKSLMILATGDNSIHPFLK